LSGIRVANAPCSFGAFEITVGVLPDVPEPKRILNAIARAHYEGTIWLASSSRTWSRGRPQDVADAVAAQERNRAWLKEHAGL